MEYYDDELYHYGKKGMKWKKRGRERNDSGETVTAEKHGEGLGRGPSNLEGYTSRKISPAAKLHKKVNVQATKWKKRFPNATARFILSKRKSRG